MSQRLESLVFSLGSLLLGSLFVLGGINKVISYNETLARMQQVGLSPSELLLPATIALELVGGLIVVSGYRRGLIWAAPSLAVFTLATNVFFHRFWDFDGVVRQLELSLFFKNISISGGLILLVALALAEGRWAQQS